MPPTAEAPASSDSPRTAEHGSVNTPRPASTSVRRLPSATTRWRRIWFQLHWFVGITAGSVLLVIGLSGASLAFREQILDGLNPGVRHVTPTNDAALTLPQIVESVRRQHADRKVQSMVMYAAPGAAPRVQFEPVGGQWRGQVIFVNPYTGADQPPMRGWETFDWLESLHRWLLLPREQGKVVAGTLALCLMGMAVSGLYLRWPRNARSPREWLSLNTRVKGRLFLRGLHSIAGTWVLVLFLLSTSTGVYWCFDVVRDTVDGWVGQRRPPRVAAANPAAAGAAGAPNVNAFRPVTAPIDLTAAWSTFRQRATDWTEVSLRMPSRAADVVQFNWLGADAPHDQARNRLSISAATGEVTREETYASLSAPARMTKAFYPLHLGIYFGWPGQLLMMLSALTLPVFAITGWMMYLKRRRARRQGPRGPVEVMRPR